MIARKSGTFQLSMSYHYQQITQPHNQITISYLPNHKNVETIRVILPNLILAIGCMVQATQFIIDNMVQYEINNSVNYLTIIDSITINTIINQYSIPN